MATDEETLKRRYREFLDLLPVTTALAGLPQSEGTFNFSADQWGASRTMLAAFKIARSLMREVLAGV